MSLFLSYRHIVWLISNCFTKLLVLLYSFACTKHLSKIFATFFLEWTLHNKFDCEILYKYKTLSCFSFTTCVTQIWYHFEYQMKNLQNFDDTWTPNLILHQFDKFCFCWNYNVSTFSLMYVFNIHFYTQAYYENNIIEFSSTTLVHIQCILIWSELWTT